MDCVRFGNTPLQAGTSKNLLTAIPKDQFEKIVLEFLRATECAFLSRITKNVYQWFQYSADLSGTTSIWMRIFQRDYSMCGQEADVVLKRSRPSLEVENRVRAQFYRSRVRLPFSLQSQIRQRTVWANCFSILPDGRRLSTNENNGIRVRCLSTNTDSELVGHTAEVTCFIVLRNGQLATGSLDGTIRVWNDAECTGRLVTRNARQVICLAELLDGRLASGCNEDAKIRVWTAVGRGVDILAGHRNRVKCLAVTQQGLLISGSDDCTVRIWRANYSMMLVRAPNPITSLLVMPDGRLAATSASGNIHIVNCGGAPRPRILRAGHLRANRLTTLSNGQLVSGSSDFCVKYWDVNPYMLVNQAGELSSGLECSERKNG